jgi:DNA-binding GntR family transcriptional regulator
MRAAAAKSSVLNVGKKLPAGVALHEQARTRLRSLIVRGLLPPGASIVETDLSASLGISRTPLREALKLLAVEGLVELRSNRSSQIAALRGAEITQVFEVMAGLEGLAAGLAAERASPGELKRLRLLQEKMEKQHDRGDLDDYFAANQEAHRLVVVLAKNPVLIAAHDGLFARAERARYLALGLRSRWDDSVTEHRDLLEALENRDPAAASKILSRHVLRTGAVVSAEIERDGGREIPTNADH